LATAVAIGSKSLREISVSDHHSPGLAGSCRSLQRRLHSNDRQQTPECASAAPLLDAEIEKMEDMITLNVTAVTRMRGVKNESHGRLSWVCQRVVPDATTKGFISAGAFS
jgi:hypothetical protein